VGWERGVIKRRGVGKGSVERGTVGEGGGWIGGGWMGAVGWELFEGGGRKMCEQPQVRAMVEAKGSAPHKLATALPPPNPLGLLAGCC